jgi:hypothetical protein
LICDYFSACKSAAQWTEQLKDVATVNRFSFEGLEMANGKAVKDLNDFLRISGDSYRRKANLINNVMRFPYSRNSWYRL